MSTTRTTRPPTSKWHPPPPPSPKILHLPRRLKLPLIKSKPDLRNLRALFVEENKHSTGGALDDGRWKAEAEALRKECELLRMERDAALEKLEKSRERKKIDGTDSIEKKMRELKVRSRGADEEAHHVREVREVVEPSTSTNYNRNGINARGCKCCCKCKEIALRIAEEVEAESGQWTELQEMLDQVRLELEDLRSSRDLWQRRAVDSAFNFRALYPHMVEWKRRAQASEDRVTGLQKHVFELENLLRGEAVGRMNVSHSRDLHPESSGTVSIKCQRAEKENRTLVCRRANNSKSNFPRRPPLEGIGNLR